MISPIIPTSAALGQHNLKRTSQVPCASFGDTLHLVMMKDEQGKIEFPVMLRVTRENLTAHIEYVRQFCTFVEAQRTKW
jgi:hypothetical protein